MEIKRDEKVQNKQKWIRKEGTIGCTIYKQFLHCVLDEQRDWKTYALSWSFYS